MRREGGWARSTAQGPKRGGRMGGTSQAGCCRWMRRAEAPSLHEPRFSLCVVPRLLRPCLLASELLCPCEGHALGRAGEEPMVFEPVKCVVLRLRRGIVHHLVPEAPQSRVALDYRLTAQHRP
eukprot:1688745-Prymnesium_polylepis.1